MESTMGIGLVLLLVVALLVMAWRLEARGSLMADYRAGVAQWKATAEAQERVTKVFTRLLDDALSRNETLVDRMGRMQREGFVDLSWTQDEPQRGEEQDGEPSEPEDWPEFTAEQIRRRRAGSWALGESGASHPDD